MRILITGATGFIGSRLVTRLADAHEVSALVRRIPPRPRPGVAYLQQDLAQPLAVQQLPERPDAIIHQAAVIDTDAVDEATPFLVNVVGTWRLLAYAATVGVKTFVHASTGGVYGCSPYPLRESDPLHPMDLYSLTKAQAELAVHAARGDFHKIMLRYFFPYGIGTPNPIPDYVRRAVQGKEIEVPASGGPLLNPLHVEDAVTATIQALHLQQDVILNIAGQATTSFAEIATLAAQQMGRQPHLRRVAEGEVIPYYRANLLADTTLMKRMLPIGQTIPLATGIAELVAYYAV
ncbi:MAG: NAD(P)-dependent oxidoreductase [Caldilineaceae bacterium]